MSMEQDRGRFKEIIKGRVRKELRNLINEGHIVDGRRKIAVPIHQLELPRLKYGPNSGGVGMGDGSKGTPIGYNPNDPNKRGGKAGELSGEHFREVELSLDNIVDKIGEDLQLPNLEPKGVDDLQIIRHRYDSIGRIGPEGSRHPRRTLKEVIKRAAIMGHDPSQPLPMPIKNDKRYRTSTQDPVPFAGYAVVYIMDISGSMEREQIAWVRRVSYLLSSWIARQHGKMRGRDLSTEDIFTNNIYIVHDAKAKEVQRDAFFTTTAAGGTLISSAYELAERLAFNKFPPDRWNLYFFHFSDGDNFSNDDNRKCLKILCEGILPAASLFGYCQVKSRYGAGDFIKVIERGAQNDAKFGNRVTTSRIDSSSDIYDCIGALLKPKKAV